jgi:5-methylcytosine-specific restriction endonuclease McrA
MRPLADTKGAHTAPFTLAPPLRRPILVAAIGTPCPYCGEPMAFPNHPPTRDHIKPRSKGHPLTEDNRVIVCFPCNRAKGSRSLASFLYRLHAANDPRAAHVEAFIANRGCQAA